MAFVATIGSFDGVHAGHRALLKRLDEVAREVHALPLVVTFDRHPRSVVGNLTEEQLITPADEKIDTLVKMGYKVLVIGFDASFREITAESFLRFLRENHDVTHLVVGFNHKLGCDHVGGEGLVALGETLGIPVTIVAPHVVDGSPVSSTRIRTLIANGEVDNAKKLMK